MTTIAPISLLLDSFNEIENDEDAPAIVTPAVSVPDRIDICNCVENGVQMDFDSRESRYICSLCHSITKSENYSIDDNQLNAKTNRIKADSKTLRVFLNYWNPIIGQEDWNIQENMSLNEYKALIDYLELNNKNTVLIRKTITCDLMRKYIKDLKLPNALNQHITKILNHIGVALPYQPTTEETADSLSLVYRDCKCI